MLSAENPAANIVGRWILSLKAKVKVSVFPVINMGVLVNSLMLESAHPASSGKPSMTVPYSPKLASTGKPLAAGDDAGVGNSSG